LLKPIRVKQLVKIVTNILNEDIASGNLKGVSVGSFLQLLEMDEKTCLLEVGTSPKNKGLLYIHQGKLYDAEYGDLQEYEAACRLIAMDNVSFKIKALPKLEIRRRIKSELMSIIMDAMKLKDEVKQGETPELLPPRSDSDDENKQRAFEADWRQSVKDDEEDEEEQDQNDPVASESIHPIDPVSEPIIMPSPQQPVIAKEEIPPPPRAACSTESCTGTLESLLARLRSIKGYKGAGIMDFTGETIASDCLDGHVDIAGVGAVFNDVFRSAQETAEGLGVHTCTELVLKTGECTIILCASGSESAVPFHLIAVLEKDGNQALTKMQLTKIIPLAARELN
ncbi:MAG: DUF4388 domain-containing protein, partial [Candidatus Electrothrix sp. AUS1_2]|nr:DUF4388 domain-containing protein [Candidatus Electrothrix sp. AUS1_2]